MNVFKASLGIILASGLAACSQVSPVPRERLAQNISPILKIEERYNQLKEAIQILGSMGKVDGETMKDLKAHSDVYYLYYWASAVQLAGGNMESYRAHVKLAEKELESIENILREKLASDPGPSTGPAADSQMLF